MRPAHHALAIPLLSALAVALGMGLAGCSSGSSSGPTSPTTATTASSSAGGASATTVLERCPTAATVSAALGSAYSAPESSNAGNKVTCNYNDPATSANTQLGFAQAVGISPASLERIADSQASSLGVTASPVPGLGQAASIFTQKNAGTNPSGVATTVLVIEVGPTLIDISSQATPAQVEALGRAVLA